MWVKNYTTVISLYPFFIVFLNAVLHPTHFYGNNIYIFLLKNTIYTCDRIKLVPPSQDRLKIESRRRAPTAVNKIVIWVIAVRSQHNFVVPSGWRRLCYTFNLNND